MQNWHFQISGYVSIQGVEQTLNIYPENIRDLIKISDYRNENMSKYMMKASLDKNFFDLIAKNAKTAVLHLKIEKFDKQDDIETPMMFPYIEDDFSIFISKDINYNKEIDYIESEQLGEPVRQDIYREVDIGLIPKASINANKVLACGTMYKSNLMSIAGFYLRNLHTLIEPFKYNPEEEQLIIPPQETLVKTIAFLNSVNVFYDTQYLFFIDEPYCTYLISRSGEGIQKKDEVYKEVFFNIHAKDDMQGAIPGMMEDEANKRYHIDISVMDTNYTINHDSAKLYNKYKEIINPNKENIQSSLTSVVKAAGTIKDIMKQFKSIGDKYASIAKSLPNTIASLKNDISYHSLDRIPHFTQEISSLVSEMASVNAAIPTSLSKKVGKNIIKYDVISGAAKNTCGKVMNSALSSTIDKAGALNGLTKKFDSLADSAFPNIYKLQQCGNHISAMSYVNVQNGIDATKKAINANTNSIASLSSATSGFMSSCTKLPEAVTSATAPLNNGLTDFISTLSGAVDSIPSDVPGIDGVKEQLSQLEEINGAIKKHVGNISNTCSTISKSMQQFNSIASQIQSCATQFSNIRSSLDKIHGMNIQSKFKSLVTDTRTLGSTATSVLDRIRNIGKKGLDLPFSYGDLAGFSKNIDSISDLTGVGKLGLSSIETELKTGGCFGDGEDGYKVFKVNNDNQNLIKNEQTEMQNMVNQLSLNKYDLDPSVFTPNKKYIIKNYNGHSEKNGTFLLNRKVEIFVREDDTFTCNTVLDFCKVVPKTESDSGVGAVDTQNGTTYSSITDARKAKETNATMSNNKNSASTYGTKLYETGTKVDKSWSQYFVANASNSGIGARSDSGRVLGTSSISDIKSSISSKLK